VGWKLPDPGGLALKSAARAAGYGSADDHMKTGAFGDPAGNVFDIYNY
jgi:hypothetical protein